MYVIVCDCTRWDLHIPSPFYTLLNLREENPKIKDPEPAGVLAALAWPEAQCHRHKKLQNQQTSNISNALELFDSVWVLSAECYCFFENSPCCNEHSLLCQCRWILEPVQFTCNSVSLHTAAQCSLMRFGDSLFTTGWVACDLRLHLIACTFAAIDEAYDQLRQVEHHEKGHHDARQNRHNRHGTR